MDSSDATLSDIIQTIFRSGTSTANQVTMVSGRGVGMSAVKAFIENVGGFLNVIFDEKNVTQSFCPITFTFSLPIDLKEGSAIAV